MKILKGTVLEVRDSRKGKYTGIAREDFDTEQEWYPVNVHQEEDVEGMNHFWSKGAEIPCRKGLSVVKVKGG